MQLILETYLNSPPSRDTSVSLKTRNTRGSRLLTTGHFEFNYSETVKNVHNYFKERKASAWYIQDYMEWDWTELDFVQAFTLFTDTLLNQLIATGPVRAFCTDYLAWFKCSDSGQAIIEVCCNVFSKVLAAKTVQLFKTPLRDTDFKNSTNFTNSTANFSGSNTRDPLRKGNFNDISKTIEDLSEEIGEEFAKKCHRSGQSIGRWENLFQLYCKENLIDFYHLVVVYPIMSRKIGERKHIVYQVSSLFKFYERTFSLIEFDCMPTLSLATKIRVYSIQSINSRLTLYSLSINGRSQYKAIIRMMAIFHE
ncbi:uncharacterized protein OCT59_029441 [Rhizophagus irregularis]|uniref:uncharacterized protein n=1 Tax=Rhizophagus irregularis TaxID=588596 RepID=UPI0033213A03|nr:hypothetical protein OCT59_029441 [Rhizophagus irregularis]